MFIPLPGSSSQDEWISSSEMNRESKGPDVLYSLIDGWIRNAKIRFFLHKKAKGLKRTSYYMFKCAYLYDN